MIQWNKRTKIALIALLLVLNIINFLRPAGYGVQSEFRIIFIFISFLLSFYLFCTLIFESSRKKKSISNAGIEFDTKQFIPWDNIQLIRCNQNRLKFNDGTLQITLKEPLPYISVPKEKDLNLDLDTHAYYKNAWEIIELATNKNVEVEISSE